MTPDMHSAPGSVQIGLSRDEQVARFELLTRCGRENGAPTAKPSFFQSPVEGGVLHGLLADLEMQLSAPLKANYLQVLQHARNRLKHGWNGQTVRVKPLLVSPNELSDAASNLSPGVGVVATVLGHDPAGTVTVISAGAWTPRLTRQGDGTVLVA